MNTSILIPETTRDCPICGKIQLKRLRNHLSQVHSTIGKFQRRQALKQSTPNSANNTFVSNDTTVPSFEEFFIALKFFPISKSEMDKMEIYKHEYQHAWTTNSIITLSAPALNAVRRVYKSYMKRPRLWIIHKPAEVFPTNISLSNSNQDHVSQQ